MSEADGLKRLTEFLNQTRKQAEVAVDCLNIRIKELEQEREQFIGERDYYKNYSEQLRVENSKKWRLQERDDWKALVDSVQKDRSRLHDECHRLEEELAAAFAELHRLEQEREREQEQEKEQEQEQQEEQEGQDVIEGGGEESDKEDKRREDQHTHEDLLEYETETECSSPGTPDPRLHPPQLQADASLSLLTAGLSIALPDQPLLQHQAQSPAGRISRSSSRAGSPRSTPARGTSTSTSTAASPRAGGPSSPSPTRHLSLALGPLGDRQPPPSPSPSPSASSLPAGEGSPRAVVRELRKELAKAHAEIDILRKTSHTESLAQEQEIERLRAELHVLRRRPHQGPGAAGVALASQGSSSSSSVGGASVAGGGGGGGGNASSRSAVPPPPQRAQPSSSVSLWSPFSVLGYLFFYPASSASSSSSSSSPPAAVEPRPSALAV